MRYRARARASLGVPRCADWSTVTRLSRSPAAVSFSTVRTSFVQHTTSPEAARRRW